MQHILSLFIKALEDQVLTEEEVKMLKQVLGQEKLQSQDIGFLRNRIAEYAQTSLALEGSTLMEVLNWLGKVNKLLLSHERATFKSSAFFAPIDDCQFAVRGFIQKAKQTLDICIFTLSDNKIGNDILFAKNRGVAIRLITDNDTVKNIGSDIDYLYKAGIPVKTDVSSNHMHHKFAISDQSSLLTGSYNWTRAAHQYNHENVLITHHPDLVSSYAGEFERLWTELKTYTP
jgi:hypothetical protein